MADWYGRSRSNYVKMVPEKKAILAKIFTDTIFFTNSDGLTAIGSEDFHGGSPSTYIEDEAQEQLLWDLGVEDADNVDDLNLLDVVHLSLEPTPDNIFVWVEAGSEKLRYISGHAVAIDHTGTVIKKISLDDIYDGTNWTKAQY